MDVIASDHRERGNLKKHSIAKLYIFILPFWRHTIGVILKKGGARVRKAQRGAVASQALLLLNNFLPNFAYIRIIRIVNKFVVQNFRLATIYVAPSTHWWRKFSFTLDNLWVPPKTLNSSQGDDYGSEERSEEENSQGEEVTAVT